MKNNKKGFSLVELLVVIAIIGILLLISFPLVDNLIKKNNKSKYDAYRNVIEEATKKYMDDLGFIVSGCYEVSYKELSNEGLVQGIDEECKRDTKVYVISDEKGNITDYKVNLVCGGKNVIEKEYTSTACNYEVVQYKEGFGGNADSFVNKPRLHTKMIPIKYKKIETEDEETTYEIIIADEANTKFNSVFEEDYSWYNYKNGYFANAVMVNDTSYEKYTNNGKFKIGSKIDESDIKDCWVWIPRFEYKGNEIKYVAGTSTEVTSGYKIHPAFTREYQKNHDQYTGFWINKNISTPSSNQYLTDYLTKGIEYNKEHKSHVTGNEEFNAAILINKTSTHTEYIINDIETKQFVGGNYGNISDYTFTNAEGTIGYTALDDKINTYCERDGEDGKIYTLKCDPIYKICNYDSQKKFSNRYLVLWWYNCSANDRGKCAITYPMTISVKAPTGSNKLETTANWYSYLDVYTNERSYGSLVINDLCNQVDFKTTISSSYQRPWIIRSNSNSDGINTNYTVTIDFSSIQSQLLNEYNANNKIGHTTKISSQKLSVNAKYVDTKYTMPTRYSMYY